MGRISRAQIFDATGRVLWEELSPQTDQNRVHLSGWNLSAGTYVLMLNSEHGQWKQKLVIE